MKLSTSLAALLLTSGLSASTLSVYQDQTLYNYAPSSSYIGMTKGVKAKCEGNTVDLHEISTCPQDKRLCKELSSLKEAQKELNSIKYTAQALEKLSALAQPKEIDAAAWIKASTLLGEEKAILLQREKKRQKTVSVKTAALHKQTPTQQVLVSGKICGNEMELILPYGYVTFSTSYEADLTSEKEIAVTQTMRIVNRSGIDMAADRAMFYYRRANQTIRPVYFDPWIVSKYEPRVQRRMVKKSMIQNSMADESSREMIMAAPPPVLKPVASYIDAREYRIKGLDLPSTGVPVEVKITSWRAAVNCKLKAYPYINIQTFNVCSFTPEYQIENNRWKIKSGKVTLNENARGEYNEGKYELYTAIDEDIKIRRRPMVKKERETGIFGGTVRKKDGFVLHVTNKSDKSKTLTLIDRIPTSDSDEIKVKLLALRSDKKINYKMLKEGKLEMYLTLDPKENKKIEVQFEISYDKDLKISY